MTHGHDTQVSQPCCRNSAASDIVGRAENPAGAAEEGPPGAAESAPGLSAYWRRNTSPFEAVELANLLRALRKVAGHLGKNAGVIEYAGMSRHGAAAIVVEPRPVMGRYPVPSDKVDYLVGWVAREALYRIEWSDRVWKLLEPACLRQGGLERTAFQKIVQAGEEIYIEQAASEGVFGLYTTRVRWTALAEAWRKLRTGAVSVDELAVLWRSRAWGLEPDRNPVAAYEKPLALLLQLSEELKHVGRLPAGGVTARCRRRADLYLKAWQDLKGGLASWQVLDKRLVWIPSVSASAKSAAAVATEKRPLPAALPPRLAREVEIELAQHSADITPIIRRIVGLDNESVAPTSRWDFQIPAHPVVDRRQVSRLRATFQNYAARRTVKSRGLVSGRVDRRRLYRAPVTGRCFQAVDRLPEPEWNVTLLMDASGSMKGKKWRLVESTVATLHQALRGSGNHLEACAYFELDGICMLSRLLKGGQLLSVPPCGQTASGQAIIAAAYFMPRGRRRNLLIHVTDGESNFGCEVNCGIEYCRQQRIHLITLGCGARDRQAMVLQYGKTLQFLHHFDQLPQAIERLLRWTFLYGAKPHLGQGPRLQLEALRPPD